jgi:hypothetical protein
VKRSWLQTYLSYTKRQESPELFHLWCGISALACTLGRNVWIRKIRPSQLYPNLYVILVSPSGKCRKGGALGAAYDILREVGVKIHNEAITKRALTQELAAEVVLIDKQPQGESRLVVYSPELEVFLGREALMSGMFSMLTSLYDCPDVLDYKTATQGRDYLYNTCLNIIGGTVPGWFSILPAEVMASGFMARIMFVAQAETPRKDAGLRIDSKYGEYLTTTKGSLVDYLKRLGEVKKQLVLSEEAIRFYESWYESREDGVDTRFSSFYEREHDHLLKVAMVLAASYGDLFQSNIINSERIEESVAILENLKSYMHLAYLGIGETRASKGYERVISQLKEASGRMDHSTLLRKNYSHFDTEGFKEVIALLEETGRIKIKIGKGGKRWYELVKEAKNGN